MNDSLKIFLISSLKTAFISTLAAGVAFMFKQNATMWFLVAAITQYVIFYLFNTFLEYKAARDLRAFQIAEAEVLAQSIIKVDCASCKKENEIIVRLDQENRFICGHCKVKNSVYIVAETAIVTEPMYETQPIPNTASTNGS
jgi:phage FluMu protein Com